MTILVTEDDPYLRLVVKTILERDGFHIIEAGDGIDGYKIIQEIGGSIDLLLTDINMPRMDGLELAASVTELHPTMPILLMTGQTSLHHPTGYVVLHKPFLRQVLLEAVWELITTAAINDNSSGSCKNPIFRLELKKHWRTEAQKAKERYEQCSRHVRNQLAEQSQGLTPTPDGTLIQASAARREYMRVERGSHLYHKSDKRT